MVVEDDNLFRGRKGPPMAKSVIFDNRQANVRSSRNNEDKSLEQLKHELEYSLGQRIAADTIRRPKQPR